VVELDKAETINLMIKLAPELHKRLKLHTVNTDTTMQDYVTDLIERSLDETSI